MVLFHIRIVELKYLQGTAFLDAIARYDAGVDVFFVLSGFVMTTITAGRYTGAASAGQFLAKRAWRVYPLYWIFTTVVVVLMAVMPSMVNSSYQDQSILASYLLIPHSQMPILTVGWTRISCFGSAATLLIAGAVMLDAQGRLHVPTWLSRLGDSSYSLYLSHVFVISAAGRVWGMLFTSPIWANHVAFVVVTTLIACAIGHLVHLLLERPLLALQHRAPWRLNKQAV